MIIPSLSISLETPFLIDRYPEIFQAIEEHYHETFALKQ